MAGSQPRASDGGVFGVDDCVSGSPVIADHPTGPPARGGGVVRKKIAAASRGVGGVGFRNWLT
ncbi:MAG: hypothetical protein ACK58T_46100, partial [Phycisphaerae bacterium]